MKQILFLLLVLNYLTCTAQHQEIHSVFFDVGKYDVSTEKTNLLLDFVKNVEPEMVESISILGYCDDRGSEQLNQKLSNDRANKIQEILTKKGFQHKITVQIQGKGKISTDKQVSQAELNQIRQANRRVDLIFTYKDKFPRIPGVFYIIDEKTKMGDRIYLKNIQFPLDRSVLTRSAINELNKVAIQLNKYKNLHVEIQGHICCTNGSPEAIDKDTRKEELSNNRAKAVYYYLIKKRVDPKRLTYKGYGNKNPLGLDQNLDKRVEFLITKS
nr:OmpA family protein [uncultured Flavobacterium sp.]